MRKETEENRREQKRTEATLETPQTKKSHEPQQQSKLPNVRFTLRDHVPRQPFLPTDADSAVQHQFRVGRVVGGVVLQQFYSFSVQLCL
jgi:hypothetical protein